MRTFNKSFMLVVSLVTLIVFQLPIVWSVSAEESRIHVSLDGKELEFESPPVMIDNFVYVPLRAIFETKGYRVTWQQDTRMLTAANGGTRIEYPVDGLILYINGESVSLARGAAMDQGRTLVPLKFISQALGDTVDWNAGTRTASIVSQPVLHDVSEAVTEEAPIDPPVRVVNDEEPPLNMSYDASNRGKSGRLSDSGLSLLVDNYAVEDDKLFAILLFNNQSGKDIRLNLVPGATTITWNHSKEKDPAPSLNIEDCTRMKTHLYIPSPGEGGSVMEIPEFYTDQACLDRNQAQQTSMDEWLRNNKGWSEAGSNIIYVRTPIQTEDGALKDFVLVSGKEAEFVVEAPTSGGKSTNIEGSFDFVEGEGPAMPFKFIFATDQPLDKGIYKAFYDNVIY